MRFPTTTSKITPSSLLPKDVRSPWSNEEQSSATISVTASSPPPLLPKDNRSPWSREDWSALEDNRLDYELNMYFGCKYYLNN